MPSKIEQAQRKATDAENVISTLRRVINHCSAAAVAIGSGHGDHADAQLRQADDELDQALEMFDDLKAKLS